MGLAGFNLRRREFDEVQEIIVEEPVEKKVEVPVEKKVEVPVEPVEEKVEPKPKKTKATKKG